MTMNTVILWNVTPRSLVDTAVNSNQGGMQEQQWDDKLAVEVYHFDSPTGESALLCIMTSGHCHVLLRANMDMPSDEDLLVLATWLADKNKRFVFIYYSLQLLK